jgi:dTDP-4-dehydrorhamnose reductase
MRIWLPGGSGMLGSHFQRLLAKNHIPFVVTSYQDVDISHEEAVKDFVKQEKIAQIINCAAYTQVDKAESESEQAYGVNATGPENLGKAARKYHINAVIHFSTDYVFNGNSQSPYREEHLCDPIGVYGKSKREGEQRLLAVYPQACIIRTSWLYGMPGNNFVETMLRLMAEREVLRVVHDQIGCPTYCEDLAEAALKMIGQAGVFHFSNSNQTSWYEFAQEIHRQALALGYPLKVQKIEPIKTEEYPTPSKRPAYSALDTHKISKALESSPRTWQEALMDYLTMRMRRD